MQSQFIESFKEKTLFLYLFQELKFSLKNKEIYKTLENTRIQMIGGNLMRGVKSNLHALYEKKCKDSDLENISSQLVSP